MKNFLVLFLIFLIVAISGWMGVNLYSTKEQKISINGTERRYRIHFPKNYDSNKKYPLVIALHELGEDARYMEIYSQLNSMADKKNFIIIYPYALRPKNFITTSWNAEICCGKAMADKVDDLLFLDNLITTVSNENAVDKNRIYMMGFSNGAMMANYFIAQKPGIIKAVGMVAGAISAQYEEKEKPYFIKKPEISVPAIIFHGTKDKVIPFSSKDQYTEELVFSEAYDVVKYWLEANQCDFNPSEVAVKTFYTKEIYSKCLSQKPVIFYAVNSSHNWPGNIWEIYKKINNTYLNASEIMVDFFLSH